MVRRKILIVDDIELNRDILSEMLCEDYDIAEADNGIDALSLVEENRDGLAVILLDIVMPGMSGLEVIGELKNRGVLETVPVLIISGEQDIAIEKQCFEIGASDFIHKPFDSTVVKRRVDNIVNLFNYQVSLEEKVAEQTKQLSEQNELLIRQAEKLRKTNIDIIEVLGSIVESRNLESGKHVARVKLYTKILAEKMQELYPSPELSDEAVETYVAASPMHDIGKIMISDNILLKPGRFTPEEFELMKTHTLKGCQIVEEVGSLWEEPYRRAAYEICRYHHERSDGKGYPDHLVEAEIPISAQLVSIADVYDALVNERCYKKAIPKDKAFEMIVGGECGAFSEKLLDCFRAVRPLLEAASDQSEASAV